MNKSLDGLENGGDTPNLTSLGEESTHLLLALDICPLTTYPFKDRVSEGASFRTLCTFCQVYIVAVCFHM